MELQLFRIKVFGPSSPTLFESPSLRLWRSARRLSSVRPLGHAEALAGTSATSRPLTKMATTSGSADKSRFPCYLN